MFDYMIVGAGFTGCVLAERLASQSGKKVLVVDTKEHVGGIAYDYNNEHGIRVQRHGLHVLHTSVDEVFEYLSRFTSWRPTEFQMMFFVDGKHLPFPINMDTVELLYGKDLRTEEEAKAYFGSLREPIQDPANAEEMAISLVGRDLYRKLFRGYTWKWWGIDPKQLPASVTARIVTRPNRQRRYQNDTHQAVPADGYTAMFQRMLTHPNITLLLNTDHRKASATHAFDRMIFTGSLDDFFDYKHGRLPYRNMRYVHETLDQEWFQPCHQVNHPDEHDYMRVFEFKHGTGQKHAKTAIVREYPRDAEPGMEPHYPVPRPENEEVLAKYRAEAEKLRSVIFVGRLADYRYYTMGQTVAKALSLFKTRLATA